MNDNTNHLELLLDNAVDYGKTSFELLKLKALDKTSELLSSFLPLIIVFGLIASFLFFVSFGFALLLGKYLCNIYIGFFIVAGFYCLLAIIIAVFFYKMLKRCFCNYIIKHSLN
jgi:hypothetical protein